ncbi:hypothetical protein AVEN_164818-1 [Araneus ventricosus]|uniref:Uncharacterized protein n=1 Tax=Araneus ventricosus TaxID=182803 RepID=A0A4Y2UFN5_ARAVE|nr:hypothetical protein AVEN_164818-1 [Araneus ventricosus]
MRDRLSGRKCFGRWTALASSRPVGTLLSAGVRTAGVKSKGDMHKRTDFFLFCSRQDVHYDHDLDGELRRPRRISNQGRRPSFTALTTLLSTSRPLLTQYAPAAAHQALYYVPSDPDMEVRTTPEQQRALLARSNECLFLQRRIKLITFTPVCTTGGSHLNVPSGVVYHRWLTLGCPIMRRVPPIADTWILHRAACATGGSHLDVPSGGVFHRWLPLECTTGAHTWISHWTVPHKFTYCALVLQCRPIKQSALRIAARWKEAQISAPA